MANPVFRSAGAEAAVPAFGNGAVNVPVPAGATTGDVLVMFNVAEGGLNTFVPGAGWNVLLERDAGGFNTDFGCYWRLATGSEPANYSVENSAGSAQSRARILAWSGAHATTPINTSALGSLQSGVTAGSNISVATITTTEADCTLVSIVIEDALRAATFTEGGSLVKRAERTTAPSHCVVDEPLTTATTYSGRTVTSSVTGDYIGIAFAIAPSAADTTAPVLTSPTGTQTGSTTATVGATTDEGNGTMYAVVTTSATQPSVAQIKAGQNDAGAVAVWAGNQAISTTGAKTLNATGLTVSSAQFTTAAGGGGGADEVIVNVMC
jgi:hypothetical protein